MLRILTAALALLFICGCATSGAGTGKTQLEIRAFQTRTYDTTDTNMVMKALLNVLQDDGFMVKNAVPELGLLTAAREVDVERGGEAFFATLFAGSAASWKKNAITEATVNVSEFGEQCRVRVNFQVKVLDNKGGIVRVEQIQDEQYYQSFFSRVGKGIFVEEEKL